MSWLTGLSEALQSVPLNAVLRERVALAEQKFKDLEAENGKLKEQVAALSTENEALRKKVEQAPMATAAPTETPEVFSGLYYFGGDHSKPYCPKCYEREGKKHHMARVGSIASKCTVCNNVVHQ